MMVLNLNGTDIAIETRERENERTRERENERTRDEEGCLLNPQDWTPELAELLLD